MPWFKINGKGALAFSASLINISSCIIEYTQHGNDTIRVSVRASYIGASCSYIVNV